MPYWASNGSSRRPAARTSASAPGRPTIWMRGREAVLGGPARERERGPAERVERKRVRDQRLAYLEVADAAFADAWRHAPGASASASRSSPSSASSVASRYSSRRRAAALGLRVGHLQAALDLDPHVLAVELAVLGEELAVDVGDLVHEEPTRPLRVEEARRADVAGSARSRLEHACADERLRVVDPGDSDLDLLQRLERDAARSPGRAPAAPPRTSSTSLAIGPAWSKLGASGKQPSSGTSPYVGLKPTTPQHAAGIRIEPPESRPERDVGRAERRAPPRFRRSTRLRPVRGERVRDDAEVRVLRGRPVRELVQVRLPDRCRSRPPRAQRRQALSRVGHVVAKSGEP